MSGEKGHLFFGILKFLQEKINCENYVIVDKSSMTQHFFQTQQIVNFKKIFFYRDYIKKIHVPDLEYLKDLETRLKINIWLIAYADPSFYKYDGMAKFSYDDMLSLVEDDCKLFEQIINEVKPDFVILHTGGQKQLNLLDSIAKAYGVKILKFSPAKFGSRYQISKEYDLLDEIIKHEIPDKSRGIDDEYLDKMKKDLDLYVHYSKSIAKRSDLNKKSFIINFLISYSQVKKEFTELYSNHKESILGSQISLVIKNLKKKFRKKFLDKYAITEAVDEKFIFFPMHMQPEMTISVCAPFYADQINVIKNIARSLPMGYKLYVKEHNSMGIFYYWRSISYYREILKMPNVRLVHPSVNSSKFLEMCKLAVTINGSVSYEALFYKKPVIVFAETSTNFIPLVTRVKKMEDLPTVIRHVLESPINMDGYKEYFESKMAETFPVDTSLFNDIFTTFWVRGVSVENISVQKMNEFINRNKKSLEFIAEKFFQKIESHKNGKIIN